jgi:membrane-bound metal-dependent hydrolase YbcI (DUF457 family)
VDPLTHVAISRAVIAAGGQGRRDAAFGAAAVLGALAPDADAVLAFAGWDRYVRVHQYGTHSIAGALATAVLTAAAVRVFARRTAFRDLLAAASAGAATHVALDLCAGGRIAVGWPLMAVRLSSPLVAMADPWLLGASLAWMLLVWPSRARFRSGSRAFVTLAAAFIGLKAVLLAFALRPVDTPITASSLEPRWGSLTRWIVYDRSPTAVRAREIATTGDRPVTLRTERLVPWSSLVERSRAIEDVRNFLDAHEFAFPKQLTGGNGQVAVMWSDLRYCAPADDPAGLGSGCAVWVGVVFDHDARAITQEVRIGSVVQRRPAR